MRKIKFKPVSGVVAQLPAGVEIDAVVDETGTVYAPIINMPALTGGGTDEEEVSDEPAPSKKSSKPAKAEKAETVQLEPLTEAELKDMETSEIKDALDAASVEIPKAGKNSNKKLRDIYLAALKAQAPAATETADDGADDGDGDGDGDFDVADFIDRLDEEETSDEEGEAELVEQGMTAEAATEFMDYFFDDSDDAPTSEEAVKELTKILDALEEEDEPAPAKKPARGRGGKKATAKKPVKKDEPEEDAPEEVEVDDLEVDDLVTVYWSDLKENYDGIVTKVETNKRKKTVTVTVKYEEDGAEEVIDSEVHTKIWRRADVEI